MIGKAYTSAFPFFDIQTHKNSFKVRPVLIIGKADSSDYVVLPISRITNRQNLDSFYDILITQITTPKMNLKKDSYIRTHKQYIINLGSLVKEIVDFKNEYPDIYIDAMAKVEDFQNKMIIKSLE